MPAFPILQRSLMCQLRDCSTWIANSKESSWQRMQSSSSCVSSIHPWYSFYLISLDLLWRKCKDKSCASFRFLVWHGMSRIEQKLVTERNHTSINNCQFLGVGRRAFSNLHHLSACCVHNLISCSFFLLKL